MHAIELKGHAYLGAGSAPAAAACLGGIAAAASTAAAAAHIARATVSAEQMCRAAREGLANEGDERTKETGRIRERGALRELFRKRVLLLGHGSKPGGECVLLARQYAILLRQF